MRGTVLVVCITVRMLGLSAATKGRKCFAPVYCDHGDSTGRPEWLQVFPPTKCHWTQSGNVTHKDNKKVKSGTGINEALREEIKDLTTKLNATEERLVDLTDKNNNLEMEVDRLVKAREDTSRSFQEKLNKLSATVEDLLRPKRQFCNGLYYQGFCYFAIVLVGSNMNYDEAVENCRAKFGKPADILDSVHYDKIFEYVRLLTSSPHQHLWLGMKFNPSTRIASLSNGNRAPYVRYLSAFPDNIPTYTLMAINVKKNISDPEQGMFNTTPTNAGIQGVLCQK